MIQPLPVGNALRVFIEPVTGARYWRVLRKGSDSFAGPDDASALIAYEGDEKIFVDSEALMNEVMAFYKPYYMTSSGWVEAATANSTPTATYTDYSTDVMAILRRRIEDGMLVECQRGNFITDLGYIQVYTAPPSLEQNLLFPLVTIHLDSESPELRGVGEDISGDEFDEPGFAWIESEGWLAQVQISVVGWSLNSDERIELRKAMRRIIVANLAVFADFGINDVSIQFQDVDAVNDEYNVPMYQVIGSFSCMAPVRVGSPNSNIITATEVRSSNG